MDPRDISLSSVNWEQGMLLTPEHFIRQERYFDSALLWLLRYTTNTYGLVGGGPRLSESERGSPGHDPKVDVHHDEGALDISVTRCRGLTPAGCMIEIDPEHSVHRNFPIADLEGVSETGVYVVCDPHFKKVATGPADDSNQLKGERFAGYGLSLRLQAADVPYSIAVARLKRPRQGSGFELDPDFIPVCTSMVSHSELAAASRKIIAQVIWLAERYTEMYRKMQQYLPRYKEWEIESELDFETLTFVGRMVVALQHCVYDIVDPVQSPQNFFTHLRRLFYNAAVYLDISPPAQQYFEQLKGAGEAELISSLEQQKRTLGTSRSRELRDDHDVQGALLSLQGLTRLENALEGRYVDFRISPALDSMKFFFDGGALYQLVSSPRRLQGEGDDRFAIFSQLRLEGRKKYRLVLAGDPEARFEPHTRITAEIFLNERSGPRPPVTLYCESKSSDQLNFEFDFEAPDVPTISDARVTIQAQHPIRTALLFVRRHVISAQSDEAFTATAREERSYGAFPGSRFEQDAAQRTPFRPGPPPERSSSQDDSGAPRGTRPAAPADAKPASPEPGRGSSLRRRRLD